MQAQTFQHRLKQARATHVRLTLWWKAKRLPCASRLKLWRSTVLPTLNHGLNVLGLDSHGKRLYTGFVMRCIRQVHHNYAHISRESNEQFRAEHQMQHPLQALHIATRQWWYRKSLGTATMEEDDISWQLWEVSLPQLLLQSSGPEQNWMRTSFNDCPDLILQQQDPRSFIAWLQSSTTHIKQWKYIPPERTMSPPAPPVLYECDLCQEAFTSLKGLRRHRGSQHGERIPQHRQQIAFDKSVHAHDGVPTCILAMRNSTSGKD